MKLKENYKLVKTKHDLLREVDKMKNKKEIEKKKIVLADISQRINDNIIIRKNVEVVRRTERQVELDE